MGALPEAVEELLETALVGELTVKLSQAQKKS